MVPFWIEEGQRQVQFDCFGSDICTCWSARQLRRRWTVSSRTRQRRAFQPSERRETPLLVALVSLEAVCGQLQAGERIQVIASEPW